MKYKGGTSRMIIDPYSKGDTTVEFEIIGQIICEFDIQAVITDRYVRYCSFILDPLSPMVQEYPDPKSRRVAASKETGYSGNPVRTFEIGLLSRLYKNMEWTLLNNAEFVFDEYTTRLNEQIIMDEEPDKQLKAVELKNKMVTQQMDFIKLIAQLRKEIFGDDDILNEVVAAPSVMDVAKQTRKK